jgi:hypothetical protein
MMVRGGMKVFSRVRMALRRLHGNSLTWPKVITLITWGLNNSRWKDGKNIDNHHEQGMVAFCHDEMD